jgi:O-antigen/teichoic acid export membrane protein
MQSLRDTLKGMRAASRREGLKGIFRVSLYRNAVFLITANVLNALFGFVFWIVVARFYTTEEVGLGSALVAAMQLLASLSSLGLGYGLIRFLPKTGQPERMINTMLVTSALAAVLAAGIFLAGLGVWSPKLAFVRDNPLFQILFIIFAVMFTVNGPLDSVFIASRRAHYVIIKNLIFGATKIVLVMLLAAALAAFGILSSWGLAIGLAVMIGLIFLVPRALTPNPAYPLEKGEGARDESISVSSPSINSRQALEKGRGTRRYRFRPVLDAGILKKTASFTMGNYIYALLWGAPVQVLSLMIVNQLGASSNAHFYVALNIAGMLFTVPTMVAMSLFAEGANDEQALKHHISQSLKMSFIILVPAILAAILLADYLLRLFGQSYAGEAAGLLRILAVSALPLAVNIIYLGTKQVEMKVRTMILIAGLTALITLGLGYFLIPGLGINGAGWAWLASHLLITSIIIAKQIIYMIKNHCQVNHQNRLS